MLRALKSVSSMNLTFFDSVPRRPLVRELQAPLLTARRLDAAVAFVTRAGAALMRNSSIATRRAARDWSQACGFRPIFRNWRSFKTIFPERCSCISVSRSRARKTPTGHSFTRKIALFELEGDNRCIVVGSHNWTGYGLEGGNLEAGVILRGQESDPIVAQVRQHIEACIWPRKREVRPPPLAIL